MCNEKENSTDFYSPKLIQFQKFCTFEIKLTDMSDNYFEKSTVALGSIVTVALLAIIVGIVFFG